MSDEPERPRVITAPLGATPAASPRPVTQVSASAVPATLESPRDPSLPPPTTTPDGAVGSANDEIRAPSLAPTVADDSTTTRDDAAHEPALVAAGPVEPVRRVGPATMMSPAVVAPRPGESNPPLAPENAVVDVGAPAHAFVPHDPTERGGGGSPGFGGPHGMMYRGGPGAGGAGGAAPGRGSSTTFMLLVVGGIIAAIALLVVAVVAVVLVTRRRAVAAADERASRQPSGAFAPGSPESPRSPPRMGGPRARVVVTSACALDPEVVRTVINAALPRLDVCFAATELDPPNHESVSYDLEVAASGEVRRAEPSPPTGRSAKLDACVVQNLRSSRMPRSTRASQVKLTFVAPADSR